MFTDKFLVEIRNKAIRKNVWFKALDHVERGIFTLTVRLIKNVKSDVLGIELVKILTKIKYALKSGFAKQVNDYGLFRVSKVSSFAVTWGNIAASKWVHDLNFARYLTVLKLNTTYVQGVAVG